MAFRLNGQVTDANAAFASMSGYRREELLQLSSWAVLTPPEFRQVTNRAARDLAEHGETPPYEKQLIRKDGSRWWALCAPTRLSGAGSASECMEFIIDLTDRKKAESALLWDISDRKLAEQALRSSEERLRLIVENARDYAIFVTDAQDRITDWFAGAVAVFGWTADEAVGQLGDMLFTPEDRAQDMPRRELETARRKGGAPNVRWHRRKDGSRVFIEGRVTTLLDADGAIRGFF